MHAHPARPRKRVAHQRLRVPAPTHKKHLRPPEAVIDGVRTCTPARRFGHQAPSYETNSTSLCAMAAVASCDCGTTATITSPSPEKTTGLFDLVTGADVWQ